MRRLGLFGERGEAKIIGTIELTTAAVLTVGSIIPMASAVGAAMACVTFLLTTSFVFTTPGITEKSSTGFPIVSTLLEQFLLKTLRCLPRPLRCFSHLCRCDRRSPVAALPQRIAHAGSAVQTRRVEASGHPPDLFLGLSVIAPVEGERFRAHRALDRMNGPASDDRPYNQAS